MNLMTHPVTLVLRDVARKLKLTRYLSARSGQGVYEEKFYKALEAEILPGDVVWDVGANHGVFTAQFSEMVGNDGSVVAFEPEPSCIEVLNQQQAKLNNVTVIGMALGDEIAKVGFAASSSHTTGQVLFDDDKSSDTVVDVTTGDHIIKSGTALVPNVIKIDTEGAELNVVSGMKNLLAQPQLRALFIEVHFSLLKSRGQDHAPNDIVNLLKKNGFKIKWPDSSHISATRAVSPN